MVNTISIIVVLAAIVVSVVIGAMTLFRANEKIRNWFFLMMLSTTIMLVGHLMELISTDKDSAFQAIRILYIGSQTIGPFGLLFIIEFCEIPVNRYIVRIPLMAAGLSGILIMWTTDRTGWLYRNYWLNTENGNFLDFDPGIGYMVVHAVPAALLMICAFFVIYRMRTWKREYRKGLFLLLLVILIPFISELIYYMIRFLNITDNNLYFTPYALLVMDVMFFFGIARYDIIGITGVATERVMDVITEAYILVDEQHRYLTSNAAAKLIFPGIRSMGARFVIEEMPGWPAELRFTECEDGRCSIEYETEYERQMPDRRHFAAEINKVQATFVGTMTAWVILIRDITAQKNMVRQLEEFAYRDLLTGLNNRRHFKELAQHEMLKTERTGDPYYVMMLDLDHFKRVNDTYGHIVGDAVLKTCAYAIKGALRVYDLLGRYGGEEFVVFLTEITKENAMVLAERIRADVEADYTIYGDKEIRLTISIGVASSTTGVDLDQTIEEADKALYTAKRDRNTIVFFTPENHDTPSE